MCGTERHGAHWRVQHVELNCVDGVVLTRRLCYMAGHVQTGCTAIHIAAFKGHKECIKALAELGSDVNKAHSVSGTAAVAAQGDVCSATLLG